jgi:hypothetical protein
MSVACSLSIAYAQVLAQLKRARHPMRCRFCETEIADKALICYRCGKPTTDARVAPVPIRRPVPTGLAASLLAALAGGAALLPSLADGAELWAGWGGLGAAAVSTALWWLRRRR